MRLNSIPVGHPRPNAAEFMDIVMGRVAQSRTPLVEYIIDGMVLRPVVEGLLGRRWVDPVDGESWGGYFDNFVEFWRRMGYDHVRFERGLPFVENSTEADDPAPGSHQRRAWRDHVHGRITNWEDFERYPWPNVADADLFPFECLNGRLAEGMGFLSCHAGGIFEHTSAIMSLEGLCTALCEQPDLVRAVADRVGELVLAYHRRLLEFDGVLAIFQGDDMGFRTQTLIGPDDMREFFLPWHKRCAAEAHAHGRAYFLHSCGNLGLIMDDLIADAGIDAKHSYEDAIIPVEDFQARYGDRIGVLGGVDINILSGGSPEDVRKRTRALIETCGARGRYAIGSGNSIPSYVPVDNYLAMIDEAVGMMPRRAGPTGDLQRRF